MDALSDILRVIRLAGGVFLDASFRAPWCVASRVSADDCRPYAFGAADVVAFHYVIDGRMQVEVEGFPSVEVGRGDLILLPRNDPHTLASEPGLPPLDAEALIQDAQGQGLARIDFAGADGERTRFVCGFIGIEQRTHPLFGSLPALLTMTLAGKPCAEWVASSFRYAAREVAARRAGSETVLARLSELLFIEALREYIDNLPPQRAGWFAGLRDPVVGRALAAIHARVAHPWTTESLAAEALLSRSAFAERFTQVVGMPPMTYLTSWRMQVAAQRLRETHQPIARIASEVGYESEATFTRAFSREIGMAPGRYRRAGCA